MLPILMILILTTTIKAEEECLYEFDNEAYRKSSILTINGLPTNLAYNPNTNNLYFTLIDLETLLDDTVQTKMDQYVIKNGDLIKIDNVNGQGAAVDCKNDKVYIATDKGLTIVNETNKANFIGFMDEDIVQLYKPEHTDDLYAVFYPDNEVYKIDIKNNEKQRVRNIPCAFILIVDKFNNIYFECDSKYMKVLPKGFQVPIEFVGIDKNAARALAIDWADRVVLAANDGLYHLKSDNIVPSKLMDLDFVPSGIVFNDNDIYLAANDIIYKFSKC